MEPLAERIPDAIAASLAAILSDDGLTYWFTPSRVERFATLTSDVLEHREYETVYILSPDRVEFRTHTGRQSDQDLMIDLALLTKFVPTVTETPFSAEAHTRWTLQNHMLADVKKKLCAGDLTLGGLCYNLELTQAELGAEATAFNGWAAVFATLRVSYRTERGAA